jgi:hypothetical protein
MIVVPLSLRSHSSSVRTQVPESADPNSQRNVVPYFL